MMQNKAVNRNCDKLYKKELLSVPWRGLECVENANVRDKDEEEMGDFPFK
mgnify:CR=1 FL=1